MGGTKRRLRARIRGAAPSTVGDIKVVEWIWRVHMKYVWTKQEKEKKR